MKSEPAFPRSVGWTKDAWDNGAEGMSLRDYFAAKAMAALRVEYADQLTFEQVAEQAYMQADTMLKAREQ